MNIVRNLRVKATVKTSWHHRKQKWNVPVHDCQFRKPKSIRLHDYICQIAEVLRIPCQTFVSPLLYNLPPTITKSFTIFRAYISDIVKDRRVISIYDITKYKKTGGNRELRRVTFKLDLDKIKMNHRAKKSIPQRSFSSKVVIRTHTPDCVLYLDH